MLTFEAATAEGTTERGTPLARQEGLYHPTGPVLQAGLVQGEMHESNRRDRGLA